MASDQGLNYFPLIQQFLDRSAVVIWSWEVSGWLSTFSGSNSIRRGIQLRTVQHFMSQSLSLSLLYCLNMTYRIQPNYRTVCRPRWLSWMCRPTDDQEVLGSTPAEVGNIFRRDWSWNIFYGHSLPSADSRRAVVSFWRKNVHNTGKPLRGLSLPSKRVVR